MTVPLRAALIGGGLVLLISLGLTGLVLATHQGDPVTFAHTGTLFTNRIAAEPDPHVTVGYDGQFVYYIARDGMKAAQLIDGVSFRFQRILLPVTARALSFGNPGLVPWVLLVINVLAHCIGAGMMAYLMAGYGASGILGALTYGLWIGSLMILRLNLNEGLCFTLALGAILLYRQKRYRWTVILLMLATLSKEIGLVFAAGLALHAWFERQRGWAILIAGAPALQLVVWWGVLWLIFHDSPFKYPAARLELIPFRGLMLVKLAPVEMLMLIFWLVIPTIILLLLALVKIYQERKLTLTTALMIPAALFVFAIPASTWFDSVAAYRVGMPIVIAGLLFVAAYYPRRVMWLSSVWLTSVLIVLLLPELWSGGS